MERIAAFWLRVTRLVGDWRLTRPIPPRRRWTLTYGGWPMAYRLFISVMKRLGLRARFSRPCRVWGVRKGRQGSSMG
eukprot:4549960-Prymnesium_polylepis.1